jgi:type VI secretion system ImpJ/VasE family protein
MYFEELLHWNDGQFLQPHHFQYVQRTREQNFRRFRKFILPYPWGIADFELDTDALDGQRVAFKRFTAILGDGLEISHPGNCVLKPLDLAAALKSFPTSIDILVAAPLWSEHEANLADEEGYDEKKIFLPNKKRVRDENTGDNEITVITRRINARLVIASDDVRDMAVMPILRLNVLSQGADGVKLSVDEKYVPPFLCLTGDCPLHKNVLALLADIHRCQDKLLSDFTTKKIKAQNFSGEDGHNLVLLRALGMYAVRISAFLATATTTPFDYYLELASLLAELMGLNPVNAIREIKRYDHENLGPVFSEIIADIRSFIMDKGGVNYVRRDFALTPDGEYLAIQLKTEDVVKTKEIYIAVHTSADNEFVVKALETGDTFKLISPQSRNQRTRGVKLSEMRYPPRFLPVLENTLWFKLDLEESTKMWREICEEKNILIDYTANLFPELTASLFVVILD